MVQRKHYYFQYKIYIEIVINKLQYSKIINEKDTLFFEEFTLGFERFF